jgi:hypothetical protein
VPPPEIQFSSRSAAPESITGPTTVSGSRGSPAFIALTPAMNLSSKAAAIGSCTRIRCTEMHDWPAWPNPPVRHFFTA